MPEEGTHAEGTKRADEIESLILSKLKSNGIKGVIVGIEMARSDDAEKNWRLKRVYMKVKEVELRMLSPENCAISDSIPYSQYTIADFQSGIILLKAAQVVSDMWDEFEQQSI